MNLLLNSAKSRNFLSSKHVNELGSGSFDDRINNLQTLFHLREYLIDFYEENQTAKDEYLKIWGFSTKDQLPLFTFDLTKRVINRVSMVYKKPPKRKLIDDSGNEIESGYDDFIKSVKHFNPLLKRAERYQKLLSNVVVRIEYQMDLDEDGGPIAGSGKFVMYIETDYIPQYGHYDTLYPVGYHFHRYGPTPNSNGKSIDHFVYVDDSQAFGHTGKPQSLSDRFPVGFAKDGLHDYGRIPVVDLSPPPINSYWGLGARALVDANRSILINMLTTDYAHQFQSYGQPWGRNITETQLNRNSKDEPQFKVGVDEMWNVGGGEVGMLSPEARLVDSAEWMIAKLNMVLSNYGLQASFKESGNPQSGFAIIVKNLELLEKRESDIDDIYRSAEQDLYDVCAAMNKAHKTGHNMPLDATVVTDFIDPDFPIEASEEREQAEWELSRNIITDVDLMMAKNPDLDQDAAEKLLENNRSANNANRSTTSGLFDRFAARQAQNGEANGELG